MVIGTDVPDLNAAVLRRAAAALDAYDVSDGSVASTATSYYQY
jgi:glycosyltransferase A (GT-A) superfamily protein (DUF2064 family)